MQMFTVLIVVAATIASGYIGFKIGQGRKPVATREPTLTRQTLFGWCEKTGNYRLDTFDGGKIWYVTRFEENGALRILGGFNEYFFGRMKITHGIALLMHYTYTYGPLTLTGPHAELQKRLLADAGMTVVSTPAD